MHQNKPSNWGPQTRVDRLVSLVRSMAIIKSAEQQLWWAVLRRAIRDTRTQNHDHDFWFSERGREIAGHVGLDIEKVRKWAVTAGVEL